MQQRVGGSPLRATLITGIIWSVWHYPAVFTDYSDYSSPFLGIATWTLLLIAQAIILAWLFCAREASGCPVSRMQATTWSSARSPLPS